MRSYVNVAMSNALGYHNLIVYNIFGGLPSMLINTRKMIPGEHEGLYMLNGGDESTFEVKGPPNHIYPWYFGFTIAPRYADLPLLVRVTIDRGTFGPVAALNCRPLLPFYQRHVEIQINDPVLSESGLGFDMHVQAGSMP